MTLPLYEPPEGDEPLDGIERAIVRALVQSILDDMRAAGIPTNGSKDPFITSAAAGAVLGVSSPTAKRRRVVLNPAPAHRAASSHDEAAVAAASYDVAERRGDRPDLSQDRAVTVLAADTSYDVSGEQCSLVAAPIADLPQGTSTNLASYDAKLRPDAAVLQPAAAALLGVNRIVGLPQSARTDLSSHDEKSQSDSAVLLGMRDARPDLVSDDKRLSPLANLPERRPTAFSYDKAVSQPTTAVRHEQRDTVTSDAALLTASRRPSIEHDDDLAQS